MPELEQQSAPGFSDPNQTLSGPIIGIIYPPPEVRSKLEKHNKKFAIPNFSLTSRHC